MKLLVKISGFLLVSQVFSFQDPPPFAPAGREAQKVYAEGEVSRNGLPITQWGIGGGTVEPVLPEDTVTPTPDPRTTTPSWNQMQGAKNPNWGVNQTWWLQNDTFRSWDHRTTTPTYWDPLTVTPSFSEVHNESKSNSSKVNNSSILLAGDKPIVSKSLNADSVVFSDVQISSDSASVLDIANSRTGSRNQLNQTFLNIHASDSSSSMVTYATSFVNTENAKVIITERITVSNNQTEEKNASSQIESQPLGKSELQAIKPNATEESTTSNVFDSITMFKPTNKPHTSSIKVEIVPDITAGVGGAEIVGGLPIISVETGSLGLGLDLNLVEDHNIANVHTYTKEDGARVGSILPLVNVVGNGHDPYSHVKPLEVAPGTIEAIQSSSEKLTPGAIEAIQSSSEKLTPGAIEAIQSSSEKLTPGAMEAIQYNSEKQEPVNIQSTQSLNVEEKRPMTSSLKALTPAPVDATSTDKPRLVNISLLTDFYTNAERVNRVPPLTQATVENQSTVSKLSTYVQATDIITRSETVQPVDTSTPILLISKTTASSSSSVSQGVEIVPQYRVDSVTAYIPEHATMDTNKSAHVETTPHEFTETIPTSTTTEEYSTTDESLGTIGGGIVIGFDHPFVMSDFGNGTEMPPPGDDKQWSAPSLGFTEKVKTESSTRLTSSTSSSPVTEKQSRELTIVPAVYTPLENILIHESNATTKYETQASTKTIITKETTTTTSSPLSTGTTKTKTNLTTAKLPDTTATTQTMIPTTTTELMSTTIIPTTTMPPPTTKIIITLTTAKQPITTVRPVEPTTAVTTEETRKTTLPQPTSTIPVTISTTTKRPVTTTTTTTIQVPTTTTSEATTTTTTTTPTTTRETKATTSRPSTKVVTTDNSATTMTTRKTTTATIIKAVKAAETLAMITSYQVTSDEKEQRPSATRSTPLKPEFRGDPIILPITDDTTLPVGPIGTPVSLESLCADTFQTIFVDSVGYTSYPGHCDKVIQCFNFRDRIFPVVRECPYGFFWDQELAQCREPVNVLCFDDPCLDFRMSSYKRGRSCRSYFECDFGASAPKCCDSGYEYVYGRGCIPNPVCNDTCDTPVTLNEKLQFSSCKFLPDQDNPFGYITHEHDGIRFRACPSGTIFSEKQCGCRWLASKRQSAHMRMKMCSPDFYMNFNNGFQELSGSNMAFDVSNVVLDTGASDFTGDGKIILWGFMNRDLGQNFAIRLKFKADAILSSGTIISNCGMNGGPTIQIALTIENVMFLVKSVERSSPAQVQLPYDPYQWNDVIMFYNGKVLLAGVNGTKRSVPLGGRIETRSNSIVLGGCPLEGKGFEGKIDEIAVYASCIPEFPST